MDLTRLRRFNSKSSSYVEPAADIHSSSDEYAARFSGVAGEWMLSVQERIILKMLEDSAARTVLDVGGGHAQIALPAARRGLLVTVLGSAPQCGVRLQPSTGEKIEFRVGNLLQIPYEDASFDSVVCIRLVSHCEDWPTLIKELCRVAKHSVIIDYPPLFSINLLSPLLFTLKRRLEGNTRTFTVFRDAAIVREFNQQGFSLKQRAPEFFIPMVVHRMLKNSALSSSFENVARISGLTKLLGSPVIVEMVRAK